MPKKKPGAAGTAALKARYRPEVERIRTSLREHVERSGLDPGTVAEKAEMSPADLDRVLQEPEYDLSYEQMLRVVRAVGVAPESFFAELYGLVRK